MKAVPTENKIIFNAAHKPNNIGVYFTAATLNIFKFFIILSS